MDHVRMDRWLWAARFFKTRSLAAHACELGRVESQGRRSKPAREVRVGDLLRIKNESGEFEIEVLGLSEARTGPAEPGSVVRASSLVVRGPAAVAQTLYRETEASRELRQKVAEQQRQAAPQFEPQRDGKPSKRERRQIHRLESRT